MLFADLTLTLVSDSLLFLPVPLLGFAGLGVLSLPQIREFAPLLLLGMLSLLLWLLLLASVLGLL
ncbi:hypothetical protein ACFR9U_15400 [Halorientalis brevis]|uniref:Uncharacterized protein n=1 Tax=Halorientalis brevis TaxID=1126241 RepID=A0ABD6CEK0_9EURY|nr:hypothetical protein [Halorientalis brevis]